MERKYTGPIPEAVIACNFWLLDQNGREHFQHAGSR
jgi:hypothetical protein